MASLLLNMIILLNTAIGRKPTLVPTKEPTPAPSRAPSMMPTDIPSVMPTDIPSASPTAPPTLRTNVIIQCDNSGVISHSHGNQYTIDSIRNDTHWETPITANILNVNASTIIRVQCTDIDGIGGFIGQITYLNNEYYTTNPIDSGYWEITETSSGTTTPLIYTQKGDGSWGDSVDTLIDNNAYWIWNNHSNNWMTFEFKFANLFPTQSPTKPPTHNPTQYPTRTSTDSPTTDSTVLTNDPTLPSLAPLTFSPTSEPTSGYISNVLVVDVNEETLCIPYDEISESNGYNVGWIKVVSCSEITGEFTYYYDLESLSSHVISVKITPVGSENNPKHHDFAVETIPWSNPVLALRDNKEMSYQYDANTGQYIDYQDLSNWIGTTTAKNRLSNTCNGTGTYPDSISNAIYQTCNTQALQAGIHIVPSKSECRWDITNQGEDIELYLGFEQSSMDCPTTSVPSNEPTIYPMILTIKPTADVTPDDPILSTTIYTEPNTISTIDRTIIIFVTFAGGFVCLVLICMYLHMSIKERKLNPKTKQTIQSREREKADSLAEAEPGAVPRPHKTTNTYITETTTNIEMKTYSDGTSLAPGIESKVSVNSASPLSPVPIYSLPAAPINDINTYDVQAQSLPQSFTMDGVIKDESLSDEIGEVQPTEDSLSVVNAMMNMMAFDTVNNVENEKEDIGDNDKDNDVEDVDNVDDPHCE